MRTEAAQAAAMIRKELKANGIAARVTSKTYSGGDSVRVCLNDEFPATKEAVQDFAHKFQMGNFNGMEDIYEYNNRNADLPQVSFVFVDNDFGDEIQQAAWELVCSRMAGFESAPESYKDAWQFTTDRGDGGSDMLRRALSFDDVFGFWAARKPRLAA